MMKKIFLNKKGFTLIEIIASLVILSIMGTVVILSSIKIIEGFIFTKTNAATSQKAHIALNRLTKEFTNITSITSGDDESIDFDSYSYDGTLQTGRSVSWAGSSGDPLLLNNTDILVDNVNSFTLAYYSNYDDTSPTGATSAKVIEFTLSLNGANNIVSTFITRVIPRNL